MKKKGEEILALFGRDVPEGTKVERKVEVGMPGASSVREAEAGKADLIVMGNSGKGSVSSFVMGSVSHYVVHHSSCPVLIVK